MYYRNQTSISASKISIHIDDDDQICVVNFFLSDPYEPAHVVYVHPVKGKVREWFTNMDINDRYILMETKDAESNTAE